MLPSVGSKAVRSLNESLLGLKILVSRDENDAIENFCGWPWIHEKIRKFIIETC